MQENILTVEDLRVEFETDAGIVHAVNGVSFTVREEEILGIVGESGSGKSVTGRSILRLIEAPGRIVSGKIELNGKTIVDRDDPDAEMSAEELRRDIRGKEIALIPQDPMESLNPVYSIGTQFNEIITANRDVTEKEAKEIAIDMLFEVGISDPQRRYHEYPHQFSGGMRQRILIAMALACEPSLIISDEPTTALDVTVEGQVLQLVRDIQDRYGTSFMWITHDMGVVAELCDRVNVMYLGEIVEQSGVRGMFEEPKHPYTESLLQSIPLATREVERLKTIAGEPPNPLNRPTGCRFHPRCPDAREVCTEVHPDARPVGDAGSERRAACLKLDEFEVGYWESSPLDTEATARSASDASRGETADD